MSLERLQKVIAHSGYTSRRKAEQLIIEGKVKVNGKTVTKLGTKVSPKDIVEIEGIPLEKEMPVYYLLYKPREVISSVEDDRGRTVVTDFLPEVSKRIYPIGRLDYQSSGIILLTNDGEFAHLMMHPKHEINKEYLVKVKGLPKKEDMIAIRKGVKSEGELLRAIKSRVLNVNHQAKTAIIELTLREGRYRHIRRMMEKLGYPVEKLKREKFGFLTLHGLQPGEYRELNPKEVNQLRNLALKNVKN